MEFYKLACLLCEESLQRTWFCLFARICWFSLDVTLKKAFLDVHIHYFFVLVANSYPGYVRVLPQLCCHSFELVPGKILTSIDTILLTIYQNLTNKICFPKSCKNTVASFRLGVLQFCYWKEARGGILIFLYPCMF